MTDVASDSWAADLITGIGLRPLFPALQAPLRRLAEVRAGHATAPGAAS